MKKWDIKLIASSWWYQDSNSVQLIAAPAALIIECSASVRPEGFWGPSNVCVCAKFIVIPKYPVPTLSLTAPTRWPSGRHYENLTQQYCTLVLFPSMLHPRKCKLFNIKYFQKIFCVLIQQNAKA